MASVDELYSLGELEESSRVRKSRRRGFYEEADVASTNRSSSVELSGGSEFAKNVQDAIRDIPDSPARIERVNDLKQRIQNGTYEINDKTLDVIASSLLGQDEIGLGLFN